MKPQVVVDINVYVEAFLKNQPLLLQVGLKPKDNDRETLAILYNHVDKYTVYISEHILANIQRILQEKYHIDPHNVADYTELILNDIVNSSGGKLINPAIHSNLLKDHEDNYILYLVSAVSTETNSTVVIITNDKDFDNLADKNYHKGLKLTPYEFVKKYYISLM